ncbi:unnamed protein product [Protopolystoma xenopodis]|uniref:Uncharacterized protein n=1 Tax=Protopolystoma xenopodis TaxID=117903 RepID=A0A448XJ56_9PLAT|nr:unnamed protein product [Protopolystoma xenopodis]
MCSQWRESEKRGQWGRHPRTFWKSLVFRVNLHSRWLDDLYVESPSLGRPIRLFPALKPREGRPGKVFIIHCSKRVPSLSAGVAGRLDD